MAMFVRDKLEKDRHLFKHDYKEKLVSTLVGRSRDMFLFASLQIDRLLECEFEEDMEDRLRDLPQSLTEAYKNIYTEAITDCEGKRKSGTKRFLDRALRWVLFSARPLTTDELLLAISQDSRSDIVAPQHPQLTKDWISARCRNLLTLDPRGYSDYGRIPYGDACRPVWRLAHQAVAEFIEKGAESIGQGPTFFGEDTDFSPEFSHCEAGKVCLMVLIDLFGGSPSEVAIGSYDGRGRNEYFRCPCKDGSDDKPGHRRLKKPLAEYASMAWPTHVRAHECCKSKSTDGLSRPLQRFLCGQEEIGLAYERWLKHTFDRLTLSGINELVPTWSVFATRLLPKPYPRTMKPIHLACHLGFQTILRDWLHSPGSEKRSCYESMNWLPMGGYLHTLDMDGPLKWSIVTLACTHGEAGIFELVLDRVPQIDTTDEDAVPPIVAAAMGDWVQNAKLLLERSKDLDSAFTREHGHVLIFIIRWNSLNVMRLLLNQVLSKPRVEQILALGCPGDFKSPDAIKILLEKGVDASTSLKGGTLLMTAIFYGWEELVCLLLERGADVNKQFPGLNYGNALEICVYKAETLSIPRLLIQHGARVGGRVVSSALAKGRGGLARLFLESKPDLNETWFENSQRGDVMTALMQQVMYGEVENVRLLIRHGADVNLRVEGKYDDALNTVFIALLERRGTTVWCDNKVYSAEQMIKVLLEAGASLEGWEGDRLNTALAAAAHYGLEEMVQNFLDRGADPNAFCKHKFVTALAAAVASKHPRALHFVRMLVENGANVNVYIPEPVGNTLAEFSSRLALDFPLGIIIAPFSPSQYLYADRVQHMNTALELALYLVLEGAIWDIDFEQWRRCCEMLVPDFYWDNTESLNQITEGLSRNKVTFFQNNPGAASDKRWMIKVADDTNKYWRYLLHCMHSILKGAFRAQ